MAHGAVQQEVPDARLLAGPMESGGEIHQGAQLVHMERELSIRAPQFLVPAAFLQRGGGGNRQRLEKVTAGNTQTGVRSPQQQQAAELPTAAEESRRRRSGIAHQLPERGGVLVRSSSLISQAQHDGLRQAAGYAEVGAWRFRGGAPAGQGTKHLLPVRDEQFPPARPGLPHGHQQNQRGGLPGSEALRQGRPEVGERQQLREAPLQSRGEVGEVSGDQALVAGSGQGVRTRSGRQPVGHQRATPEPGRAFPMSRRERGAARGSRTPNDRILRPVPAAMSCPGFPDRSVPAPNSRSPAPAPREPPDP